MSEENNEVVKQKSASAKVSNTDDKVQNIRFSDPKDNRHPIPNEDVRDKELPVIARLRKRLNVLKEEGSAKTTKYNRGSGKNFVTIPPKYHLVNLSPVLSNQNFGTISYGIYKTNADGSKYIDEQYTDIDGKKRLINAQPVIEKTVVEYFEYRKVGYMEVFNEGE